MKNILIALLSLAILVTAVVADESRDSVLRLQADVQQLQTEVEDIKGIQGYQTKMMDQIIDMGRYQ
jgi:hypothetical protein